MDHFKFVSLVSFRQDRDGCLHYSQGRKAEGKQVVKHLGVTLDAKFKWRLQVDRVSKKAWADWRAALPRVLPLE